MENNNRPNITVYGPYNDIHDNTYYGGTHWYGKPEDGDKKKDDDTIIEKSPIEKRLDAVHSTIVDMCNNNDMKHKQDFCYIKKIIEEMQLFDKFTNQNLLNIIAECAIPDRLVPSESTLKAIQIGGGNHPAWKVEGLDIDELLRVVAIGTSFKTIFKSYLFMQN